MSLSFLNLPSIPLSSHDPLKMADMEPIFPCEEAETPGKTTGVTPVKGFCRDRKACTQFTCTPEDTHTQHKRTEGHKGTNDQGALWIWKRARGHYGQSPGSVLPAVLLTEGTGSQQLREATRRPPAGPGWGWGASLIGLLAHHPAEETAAGFSLQMTGNTMEGYLGSNYYFEKGEKS